MNQTIYFLFHRLVLVATTSIIGVAIESEIVSILTSSKFCVCIPVRIFLIFRFWIFWMDVEAFDVCAVHCFAQTSTYRTYTHFIYNPTNISSHQLNHQFTNQFNSIQFTVSSNFSDNLIKSIDLFTFVVNIYVRRNRYKD